MKKLTTLMLAFVLLLTVIGCPVALASGEALPEITVEHTARRTYALSANVTDNEAAYTFFAASYDSTGKLISVEKPATTIQDGVATATVALDEKAYAKDAVSSKFLLWNHDSIQPYASVAIKTYSEATDVASGKSVYGTGNTNAGLYTYTATALTDGDEATHTGFFGNSIGLQGYMYLDLGASYKIDRIEVLGYSNSASYPARAGYYDVLVSKNKPALAPPFAEDAKAGETVVATREETATTSPEEFRQVFGMPAGNEEYRYVSLEKLYQEIEDGYYNWEGLLIAEVKVYVLNEDMPEQVNFVEVANGKPTGGYQYNTSSASWDNSLMYAASNMNDNNADTYAAFYLSIFKGLMYIDLGQAYEIDHIDVLAYNGASAKRCSDYNIVAGNTKPDTTAYTADNTIGEVLVATVPQDIMATSAAVGYKTFYMPDNNSYRFISLEKLQENTDGLFIREVKVYVREDKMPAPVSYVEVARNKSTGGGCVEDGKLVEAASNLVDGNINTRGGFYVNRFTGNMYIDLGDKYKIDHIKVLSYNESMPARVSNYDVVISNTVTPAALCADPDKVTVASGVGPTTAANVDTAVWFTYLVPEDSEEFRFVSIEKSENDGAGLLIHEVEVYVREDNMPKYVEVAQNKATGGGCVEDGKLVEPASNLVDGDNTTRGGFYVQRFTGNMYIDLGAKNKIEYIKVLSYNESMPARVSNYDVVISNTVEAGALCTDPNKVTVASGVGPTTAANVNTAKWFTYYVPEDSGEHRFVSIEKSVNDGAGLLIHEVEVYVREENVVVPATNVALGKTDWTLSKAANSTYNKIENMTDGNYFSTYASAVAIARPNWMVLDLGDNYDLEKLLLDCTGADITKGVTVFIGNTPITTDAEFSAAEKTTVYTGGADGNGSSVININLENPVNGRYIMIHSATTAGAGDYFWLAELEAWGK